VISAQQAAKLGLMVQYAFDAFRSNPGNLAPPADLRLSPDWQLLGHIVGRDCLFGAGPSALGEDVCYGFLVQSTADPTQYVAAVRGTGTLLEWLLDAEFISVPHPVVGRVESGFWRVYNSLRYVPLGLASAPASLGLANAVGPAHLMVVGHSLGASVATYLAFDLAALIGDQLSACFLASPRSGDAVFTKAFDARVKDYALWNYELDFVPRVPRGPDYTDLPRVQWIGIEAAQARIGLDVACGHHVVCYAAMLDWALAQWSALGPCDVNETACIRGPRLQETTQ
jgi:hypothetical protein